MEYQYCDPKSILLVNPQGVIRRLFCPFPVRVIEQVDTFKPGTQLYVDEVGTTAGDALIFVIYGVPYLHSYFAVTIRF